MMKNTEELSQIIQNYVNAYNNFDVVGMLKDLHDDIIFNNISNGEVNLTTKGKTAFEEQALQAKQFFKTRQQTITKTIFNDEFVEVTVDYQGVIAIDLPNGLKRGDTLQLHGKSIFKFMNDKIIEISDIS